MLALAATVAQPWLNHLFQLQLWQRPFVCAKEHSMDTVVAMI